MRGSTRAVTWATLRAPHRLRVRRVLGDDDERLVVVGVVERGQRRSVSAPAAAGAAHVASSPRSIGTRCGVNSTVRPSSCSISAVWRWVSEAVGGRVVGERREVQRVAERAARTGRPAHRVDEDGARPPTSPASTSGPEREGGGRRVAPRHRHGRVAPLSASRCRSTRPYTAVPTSSGAGCGPPYHVAHAAASASRRSAPRSTTTAPAAPRAATSGAELPWGSATNTSSQPSSASGVVAAKTRSGYAAASDGAWAATPIADVALGGGDGDVEVAGATRRSAAARRRRSPTPRRPPPAYEILCTSVHRDARTGGRRRTRPAGWGDVQARDGPLPRAVGHVGRSPTS